MPQSDSPYFAFGSILAFIAAAMFAAAVASPDWYEMHSGSDHFRVGYFEVCNTTGGPIPTEKCSPLPFDEEFCGNQPGDMKARQAIGAGLGLLGAALMVLVVLFLLIAWCRRTKGCLMYTSLVLAVITLVGFLLSIILIANTFESWYYCGSDYCSYRNDLLTTNVDCVTFHGYSFVYAVIALLAAVMCFCTILSLLIQDCLENRDKKELIERRRRQRQRRRVDRSVESFDEEEEEEELLMIEKRPLARNALVAPRRGSSTGHSPFHDNRRNHGLIEAPPRSTTSSYRHQQDTQREGSRSNRTSPARNASSSSRRASPTRASTPLRASSPPRNPIEEIARSPSSPTPGRHPTPSRHPYGEVSGLNDMSEIPSSQRAAPMPQQIDGEEDEDGNKLGYWPSDWVFHPQSKLYWSTSQQLYLDPASEHYYDPHSGKWYDPKRDVWYDKEEDS